MDVGVNRVQFNTERLNEIAEAITRDDIRALIKDESITKKPAKGNSRGRLRAILAQKKKGRRRGYGHRTGSKTARTPRKKTWISKIRAIRDELRKMKSAGQINEKQYRKLYRQAKGNMFHSRRHLRESIERARSA